MRSIPWRWLALFIVAYTGSLTYFWAARVPHREWIADVGTIDVVREREDRLPNSRMDAPVLDNEPGAQAKNNEESNSPSAALADAAVADALLQGQKERQSMLAQATSAESANERGRAIVALRAGPRSMDAVVVLAQVAHTDESPRNRIAAVAALRALAAQGDEDNLIKGALQRASLDSDRRVAAGARSALSQVREGIDVNLFAEALPE